MSGPGRFTRLEARMESLVEGTLARLFAGRVHLRDVALQLSRALEDSAAAGNAATHYTVHLNPADAQSLLSAQPDLAEQLAIELLGMARAANLVLTQAPQVTVEPDPARPAHSVAVTVQSTPPLSSTTQTVPPLQPARPHPPRGAFVILDGQHTVPLTAAVINLGRRLDNQIIVDDPRVSRNHAQLRLRFGHYVIYNLGSTGGTFVNGQRVEECVLRPGDVISLGGVPLIYGDDGSEPGPAAPTPHSTMPLPPLADPPSGDRDDQP